MRLVFMGTPHFAVPAFRSILQAGHEIAAVVTRPDRPRRSRSSPPEPSPVKAEAARHGLPVLQPLTARDPDFRTRLESLAPESIVVVAFGQILPVEILRIPPRFCINLHASILPKYRGAAPTARAILAGEKVTGCSTIKMERGLDTGDILLARECAIGLQETAGELTGRLAELGAGLLVETLERHARGALEPRRQDAREATQAPALAKEDGRIDWSEGAPEIACRVRACNPWPLAFTYLRGQAVQILRAEIRFEAIRAPRSPVAPGQVIRAEGERIVVQCGGEGRLSLLQLRFAGRRTMSARDALNGRLVGLKDTFTQTKRG